ncbi:IS66 family transposase zinc-finger binding domain-containing protein [Sedimentitalea nanhaiensis]|uniref:IS66 family transposase zinc-finger binding domain-containing protein n=1 Tax=Sedimentitalea nanhaiensis TaxID=999627 RepID=UPI00349E68A0
MTVVPCVAGCCATQGGDVTEEPEYVPGRFIVNRIVRPRFACWAARHSLRRS